MHNHPLKFNFSCPSDHIWNNNCKVLVGFQLSRGAGFTSSPWDSRWGFQDHSVFSPTFFAQGRKIAFCWLGLPEPHTCGYSHCFVSCGLAGTVLSIKPTRLWGHICGTSPELLPWVNAPTYCDRYKNLHSGLSPFHPTGSFSKLITISLHTSDRTRGTHTEYAKPFQKRDYFPEHSTTGIGQDIIWYSWPLNFSS